MTRRAAISPMKARTIIDPGLPQSMPLGLPLGFD